MALAAAVVVPMVLGYVVDSALRTSSLCGFVVLVLAYRAVALVYAVRGRKCSGGSGVPGAPQLCSAAAVVAFIALAIGEPITGLASPASGSRYSLNGIFAARGAEAPSRFDSSASCGSDCCLRWRWRSRLLPAGRRLVDGRRRCVLAVRHGALAARSVLSR
jgi:hypothetical protein